MTDWWDEDEPAAAPAATPAAAPSKPAPKSNDSWGGWGDEPAAPAKPAPKSNNNSGGWGDEPAAPAKPATNGSWGGSNDTKSNGNDGGWGGSSETKRNGNDGGWGGSRETKSNGNDGGWGGSSETKSNGNDGGWGGSSNKTDNPYNSYQNGNGGNRGERRERPPRDNNNNEGGWGGQQNGGGEGRAERPPREPILDENGEERQPNTFEPTHMNEDDENLNSIGCQAGINFKKYKNLKVVVSGEDVPPKIETFAESALSDQLKATLTKNNYNEPTPCQQYSIPIGLARRDLMVCAQTGSGKTAAFLLPIIHLIKADGTEKAEFNKCQTPQALIICPTRELVIQTFNHILRFARGLQLRAAFVYGGTASRFQMGHLEEGANIVVATPGRLKEMIGKRKIDLSATRYVVLDEADRMLDMGFADEVKQFIMLCKNEEKQVMMFSATFPADIQRMAMTFMRNHIYVAIGVVGGANSDIKQEIKDLTGGSKLDELETILQSEKDKKTLIFVKTKKSADFLCAKLNLKKFGATSIHGDRYQSQREEALSDFITGKFMILVATSVAARGLDIPQVDLVVNYDMPDEIEEYVHRIGRTARVGNCGTAISFFDADRDGSLMGGFKKVLEESEQTVPEWLAGMVGSGDVGAASDPFNATRDVRTYAQQPDGFDPNEVATKSNGFGNNDGGWGNAESKPSSAPAVNSNGNDDDWF